MPRTHFEQIWNLVVAYIGETFRTKSGKKFIYRIKGEGLYSNRTSYRIQKSDVRKAYEMIPIDGPSVINYDVRGASYVWAILHDKRISKGEW